MSDEIVQKLTVMTELQKAALIVEFLEDLTHELVGIAPDVLLKLRDNRSEEARGVMVRLDAVRAMLEYEQDALRRHQVKRRQPYRFVELKPQGRDAA